MRFNRYLSCVAVLLIVGASTRAQAGYTTLYANDTNFTGYGYAPGAGTKSVGGSLTTVVTADDITGAVGTAGASVNSITFSVFNANSVSVAADVEVLIYGENTAGTGPGTVLAGLLFNPITFTAGSVATYTYTSATSIFTMPSGTFWAGLAFVNLGGTTGATAAQLNELGQGLFAPPTVGSSSNEVFIASNASSTGNSNPAGSLGNFGSTGPTADFGWEFDGTLAVPEPPSGVLMGVAGLLISGSTWLARSRRSSMQTQAG